MTRYNYILELRAHLAEFIRRVEAGEVRSTRTYADARRLIAKPIPEEDVKDARLLKRACEVIEASAPGKNVTLAEWSATRADLQARLRELGML